MAQEMLVGLDQARERERASKANQEVAGVVFVMLEATAGVVATASGDHRAADRAFRESDRVEAETQEASARHDAALTGLQAGCARAGEEEGWFSFRQEVISAEPIQRTPPTRHRDFD